MHLHHHQTNLLLCSLIVLLYVPTSHLMNYPIYPCRSNRPIQWERDSQNCNTVYFCFYGQPILMPPCPSDQVWSQSSSACVQINSQSDDCKRDSPCLTQSGNLRHPLQCHWYYNCSSTTTGNLIEKCPFPQLFNDIQLKCDDIPNVNCSGRHEPFSRCEYDGNVCRRSHCRPCWYHSCRGNPDGNYTMDVGTISGRYVTCYYERTIAEYWCPSQTPIYSIIENKCVTFFTLAKELGGMKPDCRFRANGYYPDELGRCNVYFQCNETKLQGFIECNGKRFNPVSKKCQSSDKVPPPCGSGSPPSCVERQDGLYADIGGRCAFYFECKNFVYKSYHYCSSYGFNPYQRTCVKGIKSQIKPCGIQDNPCENRLSGLYAHNSSSYLYYECSQGLFIYYGICPTGQSFNISSSQCETSKVQDIICVNKTDGRYKYPEAECLAFYECSQQKFFGLTQCTDQLNGTHFNSLTGTCDKPQNICPPCGSKQFNCTTTII